MALTLKVDNPTLPKGEEIAIDSLGIAKNGEVTTFSDEEVAGFESKHSADAATLIKNAAFVTIVKEKANA